ncbi:phytanoyl-CoA dioxygenase family protein [Paenibacillus sp. LHD-38]|uniref:phytanoyl-CoA dioxygenase family protein n=1 Tax=Paenibacillus sp. LHD-38 TaxID=3072143 RepID=UPI00280F7F16|nr:phytanoyl-CoA dioxygenase family protein [Paenibacillus sp. LHD-38]MDQ8736787.1 phytanoyl-CoA dioxygenase family protein [Paenibacillus sp. LHD-38]
MFYQEQGYWISDRIFDDEQVERLRKAHDRIWARDYDGHGFPLSEWESTGNPYQLRKMDNAWWVNDEVREAVTNPLIGQIAAQLMDTDEVRLWYDQAIYKPGTGEQASEKSGNVGWHQDYPYWQCTDKTNLVTAWVALQDTAVANGSMLVIPGSHKWGLVPTSDSFFNQDLDALKERFAKEGRTWNEVPMILKAGHVSFHHAYTFHASGPNRSNDPRLSVVAHLMPGDTAYQNKGHNVDNIRLLGPRPKEGQRFDNSYFPKL